MTAAFETMKSERSQDAKYRLSARGRRINLFCAACILSGCALLSGQTASDPTGAAEIKILKSRVAELEAQNRAILEALASIRTKLGLETVEAKAAPTSSPTTPASVPQTEAPGTSGNVVRWNELSAGGNNKLKFYGLLRLDMDIDSQRPNSPQSPLFIASPDPGLGGKPDAGNFSMHPRLTRFGVDYSGPQVSGLWGAQLSGKLELDFENGGSESRQIIRIRHAYMELKKGDVSFLAGQTWDLLSPLIPTVDNDTLLWNAGNIGDRRPQIQFSYQPKVGRGRWSIATAAGLTGAIDAQDLDNNTYRDGEESGKPDFQARVGYGQPLWVSEQSASFGVSTFYGWENTSKAIGGRTLFHAQATNVDYTLPLSRIVSLRGEGWWGRNMSDIRGGAGQGINVTNGREIRGRGGWSELTLRLSRYYSLHPGFSVDSPVPSDVPIGGRTRNQVYYFGNRITPGGDFTIGADYLRWWTSFQGYKAALDNRINIFFQYAY
jgi:hypothetical protein